MEKSDHLKECNNQGVPLEDFKLTFCNRCLQPECHRSTYGLSKFDVRTQTWKERLFDHVPRMAEVDPRFSHIKAQKFLFIEEKPPSVNGVTWNDPRDLGEKKTSLNPVEVKEAPPSTQESLNPPVKTVPVKLDTRASGVTRETILLNTPSKGDQFLPVPVKEPTTPKRDPWAVPNNSSEVVTKVGATIKLGVK